MSKLLEQVLHLDPDTELHFKGPFTDVVTSYLSLYNPSERRVCFKVKTTAPKRYCVRPNSGFIEPKETMHVAVMLQPFEYDPHEKHKHKFMVQTMFAPSGDVSLETLWKDANSENLMDSKLKCVFDPPPEMTPQNDLDSNIGVEEKSILIKPSTDTVLKSSPKATSADQELKKVQEECKRLKDELAQLQQLNSKLKEEQPRQRTAHRTTESPSVIEKHDSSHSDSIWSTNTTVPLVGLEEVQQQTSMMFLFVIVAAFVLGFLTGKFLL
ncbi:vesicle-associated membrane protein-associated protein A-like [Tachypleus tridentatus]|uniref:vesicle-associated membrane protein-associated protein A-like n=1 Tax=Tachypleus tridentatus TaxID=6853 RepID=UPI003FCF5B6C